MLTNFLKALNPAIKLEGIESLWDKNSAKDARAWLLQRVREVCLINLGELINYYCTDG